MIEIIDRSKCCGCNACGDICPSSAISFSPDEEGFLYPTVDKSKCIQCGLCNAVCPCLNPISLGGNSARPRSFAAVHKNLPTRFASTSGGVYSALAKAILRQGGALGGAVWTEQFAVKQIVSSAPNDLLALRGSKYAQSDAQHYYEELTSIITSGKPVLACGTPCQIVAFKNYLTANGKIFPANVYLIDFICCGNNSPMVMEKFLQWKCEENGAELINVRQKSKELGWRKLTFKMTFKGGKVVYEPADKCRFTQGFIGTHQYCRPSCYDCMFKGENRASDITIADYWGDPSKLNKGMDDDLGTSAVFVRTEKGRQLMDMATGSLVLQELPFDVAIGGNRMYFDSLSRPQSDRTAFFKALREGGFKAVLPFFESNNAGGGMEVKCHRTLKSIVRSILWRWRNLRRVIGERTLWLNKLTDILQGRPLVRAYAPLTLEVEGKMTLGGDLHVGMGFLQTAPNRTSIAVRTNGEFITKGPNWITYGADIEVFGGAKLEMGRDCVFNLNANIICGGSIKIGDGVCFGRNVTVRDNNGGHWTNLPGYKNIGPVEIGDHVWLTEGCTIMPGVKIGSGAIVGAKAVVFNNVPPNTLVMGNPAKVVSENVEWKQ